MGHLAHTQTLPYVYELYTSSTIRNLAYKGEVNSISDWKWNELSCFGIFVEFDL